MEKTLPIADCFTSEENTMTVWRCPSCGCMLAKVGPGDAKIQIKCRKCNNISEKP